MRRLEAIALLSQYAPSALPQKKPVDFLMALLEKQGDSIALDDNGDFLILKGVANPETAEVLARVS